MNLIETSFVQLVWQQIWQCSLLVLAVFLLCKLIKFRRSHLTFILWLIVLLKFMTPPLWTSSSGLFCWIQEPFHSEMRQETLNQGPLSLTRTESIRLMAGDDLQKLPDVESKSSSLEVTIGDADSNENRNAESDSTALVSQSPVRKTAQRASKYSLLDVGLIVWAFIAFITLGVMGVRYWRCWRIIRCAGEQHQPEFNQLLKRLLKELKVKRSVRLLITKSRMGPAVMGLFRPTIILPKVITDARSLKEMEPILAHELIHIRRGDLWVGLLQLLASVVWWFNPLVWFTGRRLKFEIEQCCDEEVLAELKCDPGIYAKCLLEVLELKQSLKTVPIVPGVRPVEITSKRLERIMKLGQGCHKRTPWWCWMIFVGLMVVILPGAAFVVSADDQQNKPAKISQKEIIDQSKPVSEEPQTTSSASLSNELLSLLPPESIPEKFQRSQSSISTFPIQFLFEDYVDEVDIKETRPIFLNMILYQLNGQLEKKTVIHGKNESVLRGTMVINPWVSSSTKDYHMLSRKDDRILMINDSLLVMSENPKLSQDVSRILQFLKSMKKFTKAQMLKIKKPTAVKSSPQPLFESQRPLFQVKAKFISVPKHVVDKLRVRHKKIKLFTSKQVTFEFYKDEKQVATKEPETVSHPSMICDVLDAEHSNALVQKFMASNQIKVFDAPQIVLENNQTASVDRKRGSIIGKKFTGVGQLIQKSDYGIGLDLHPAFFEQGSHEEQIMLDYKLTFSKVEGQGKLMKTDLGQGRERSELIELIKEQRFKDVTMIHPGQTLVVGGFKISESAFDSKLLLVLLDVKKVSSEQDQVKFGVGVNSDAGVTGQILIDETNFQDNLITMTYPVADLVIPFPRKFVTTSKSSPTLAPPVKPRFEPLIDLIKKNVTPENWKDEENQTGSIMAYKETLSLIVRHTREAHDQIAELLQKLRAVQDLMIQLNLQLVQTDHLQKWLKEWERSEVPALRNLLKQLKTQNLDEGITLSSQQAGLMEQMVQQTERVTILQAPKLSLFNGQSVELSLNPQIHSPKKSECRVQLRTELLKELNLRLSMTINANDALDVLSNLKSMTIPKGSSVLIDITDQIIGNAPAFLPYQRLIQSEQKSKKQKRFFLLINPSILNNSD